MVNFSVNSKIKPNWYVAFYVYHYSLTIFMAPLQVFLSEKFTISNKNVLCLLLLMTHWRDLTTNTCQLGNFKGL